MRRLALLFLVVPVVLGAEAAHAKCGPPRPFVMPEAGTPLPPNPVLYVFFPRRDAEPGAFLEALATPVRTDGRTLPAALRLEPSQGIWTVVRVAVTAVPGTTFGFDRLPSTRDARWSVSGAATTLPPSLVLEAGDDETSSWTCSFTSYRVFRANVAAPAWRVELAATPGQLSGGEKQVVVLPGRSGARTPTPGEAELRSGLLKLGHVNCHDWNFRWPAPRIAFRATALTADGRELASTQVFEVDKPPDWAEFPRRR